MAHYPWHRKPIIGVLAGWQFYRTATNLSYLKPIFKGINQAARHLGCNVLFSCGMGASASPQDPIRPAWPVPAPDVDYVPVGPENTDGLIVFSPLHSLARSQYIQDVRSAGHPVLYIGSGENGPTIAVDNEAGIREAVGHLVQHGHQQIAFLAGSLEDMQGDTGERLRAFEAQIGEHGLASDPRRVVFGRHVFDGGYAGMLQILESGVTFTAVVASNDEMALGAMQALKERGRSVPGDAAVIGFDNRLEGATHDPALSSIHVPLYEMGYHAVELMHQHLQGRGELNGTVKVHSRLVIRQSCGCGGANPLPGGRGWDDQAATYRAEVVERMVSTVLNQAQRLSEGECRVLCQRMLDATTASIRQNDGSIFLSTLSEVLAKTAEGGDDAHIWQEAVTLLMPAAEAGTGGGIETRLIQALRDQARQAISAQMQHQHRQYIVNQRWINSRLSLLTASLQTALDETRIYEILAQHLLDMDIQLALIVLFEQPGDDPTGWSVLRSGTHPEQRPARFASPSFPPAGLFDADDAVQLALIPLVDQNGQMGYVVFETDHFDLYGAIVQQLGGAFHTAWLYRQATEGRRLAEEANRIKSRFLSTISHELRTPLNLIVGLSGMILQDSAEGLSPLPAAARKDIGRILAYSQHLGGLIGDVIDLATSEAGELRLNHENVNLSQVLQMTVESGRQLAADKGLGFEASFPESGPWVWGDPTRMRQVTLNLINNAVKYTTHGMVRLSVLDNGETASVLVSDTGMGISPADQQAVFDEFWQAERSVARGYGGLGLGLAISKRLIEMHGGKMSVYSSGKEGSGSVFSFTLPAVQPQPVEPQRVEKSEPVRQTVAVLSAQPGTSERLGDALRKRGFDVQALPMKVGGELPAEFGDLQATAIVVDMSENPGSGWETLRALKSHGDLKAVPVLLFSSSPEVASLVEVDYLTRPIELSELASALDQQWLTADATRPTRTVLVADDEPITLEMYARIAQAHSSSNRVLKARNGKEALEMLHQEVVDLVLLDLQMPEMDGFEVLEAMRSMENLRKIPVIVLTGKSLTEADMTRLNQGVTAVLSKGLFSIDETIAHISTALENKRKISEEAQRLVRLAIAYLHENYAEPLARRDIAQYVGISEDHLTFCFRQELGTTPIEYLQRYRINQARFLLKETTQTITEIAQNVGFSDSGYFSRIFRRETGMTPETFRRS